VKKLVELGASINLTNNVGQTVLHFAEREHNPCLSEILLKASADATATDESGQTPLHYATTYSNEEREVTKV
jgi:ankyrin repeat protein